MPRVTPDTMFFRVELTEYERGWGSKHWDTFYYDNEAEAKQYVKDYNAKHNNLAEVPDWYVVAEYRGRCV